MQFYKIDFYFFLYRSDLISVVIRRYRLFDEIKNLEVGM